MIRKLLMTTTCSAALVFGAAAASAADLLEEVKDSDQLSTFAKAVEAAGLEDTLEGDGPYTIFAPTDDAFDELPDGVVDALMEDDNKDQLEKLLKAHIVEGEELAASDIKDEDDSKVEVEPMEGDELTIDASGDDVRVELAGRTEGGAMETPQPSTGVTGQPSTTIVTPSGADDDVGSREAKVVEADMEADNGVIHAIDAVLVPEDLRSDLRDTKDKD
jgi:uncharacterized surface protein with fasciclin (FAS1) repeats